MGRNKKYSLGRYQIVLPPIDFFFGYQHFLMQMSPVFLFFFKLDYNINGRSVFSFFHLSHIRQCLESHAVRKKDHDQV